jgi:hypothetical protein
MSARKNGVFAAFGAGILTISLAAGAFAASGNTVGSRDIVNGSIQSKDIKDNTIRSKDVRDGTLQESDFNSTFLQELKVPGPKGDKGDKGDPGSQGPKGDPGQNGQDGKDAQYVGPNWSIIDRNVYGNGDSYLRSGPDTPPSGIGSLGMRTGSTTDKAAFGNQVDFVGMALSSLGTVSYSAYVTGEDLDGSKTGNPGNIPNIQFEVNPHTARSYTTLVFVPPNGSATANTWSTISTAGAQWYYTSGFGTDSGCNQTTYCTLQQAMDAAPNGTLISAQFSKGRDWVFSGAVDKLTFGGKTYDFEPFGVSVSNAS